MHLAPLAAVGADGGAPVVLAGVPDCRYTGRQMPVVFLITVILSLQSLLSRLCSRPRSGAVTPNVVMLADARAPASSRLCWQMLAPPKSVQLLSPLCWMSVTK